MRWIAALVAVCLSGCANIGSPPGGPLRTTPPELLEVSPESGAVNVRARNVVFVFDAVVSDRASIQGGNLDNVFLVSPDEGRPRVRWRRSRIEVRPRKDFLPNTAYSVTMLPGIADLRGNVIRTSRTIVFSTGPTIPPYQVLGRVFDWMSARVVPKALVEAIRHPDSAHYVGTVDSTGQFAIGPLDSGTYTVRAIIDANNNRGLDPGESWDSLPATVRGSSPFLELLAAPRDTVPPRLLMVTTPDTLTLLANFDRPLDPAVPLLPTSFRVVGSDSVRLNVVSVRTSADVAAEEARLDSAARRDSLGRDTTARPDTLRARRIPGMRQPGSSMQLKPSKPTPARDVVIRLDSLTPMRTGQTYRVTAVNMRGLLGHVRTSDREITMTPPVVRSDSAAAKRPVPVPPPPIRRP